MGAAQPMKRCPTFLAIAAAFMAIAAPSALAEPAAKYPIYFHSMSDLQQLGISLQWPMIYDTGVKTETLPKPGLPIGCYLYAGQATMSLISISEEFLAHYKAKGFTRESLCMGLASYMKYDPETGKRLPTYIYRDDAMVEAAVSNLDADTMPETTLTYYIPEIFADKEALKAGIDAVRRKEFGKLTEEQLENLMSTDFSFLSNELPLVVPDCFKNGTPYLDCNWRYGLLTGRKLSDAAPKMYRAVGETIDRHMQVLVKYKTWDTLDISPYLHKRVWGLQMNWELDNPVSTWTYSPTIGLPFGETMGVFNGVKSINGGEPLKFTVENNLHAWAEEVTWFDVSPSFPRGYGYNLTSIDEGFGDGGASAASILAAYDGSSSSARFSAGLLKKLLLQ
jgi:hypothetical protein